MFRKVDALKTPLLPSASAASTSAAPVRPINEQPNAFLSLMKNKNIAAKISAFLTQDNKDLLESAKEDLAQAKANLEMLKHDRVPAEQVEIHEMLDAVRDEAEKDYSRADKALWSKHEGDYTALRHTSRDLHGKEITPLRCLATRYRVMDANEAFTKCLVKGLNAVEPHYKNYKEGFFNMMGSTTPPQGQTCGSPKPYFTGHDIVCCPCSCATGLVCPFVECAGGIAGIVLMLLSRCVISTYACFTGARVDLCQNGNVRPYQGQGEPVLPPQVARNLLSEGGAKTVAPPTQKM